MPISSIVASSETGIESQIPVTPANCGIIQNTGIRKTKPLNKAKLENVIFQELCLSHVVQLLQKKEKKSE